MKNRFLIYLYEALGLGIFMFSAAFFTAIIENPNSIIRQHIGCGILRSIFIGIAMGGTALFIFTSTFGKKSGAHINPAVSIVHFSLGNLTLKDTFFYIFFQCLGGFIGLYLMVILMPNWMADPYVNYIVTKPFENNILIAFIAEFFISFITIFVVLYTSAHKKLKKYTNYFVAFLIFLYVVFESPLSGFSMNPARTLASALIANEWKSFWIYCAAPIIGMLCGTFLFICLDNHQKHLLKKKEANLFN